MLNHLQLGAFYALWGDTPWGETPTAPQAGARESRVAEGKEIFQPVDVIRLNENQGNMETEHQLHWTARISVV